MDEHRYSHHSQQDLPDQHDLAASAAAPAISDAPWRGGIMMTFSGGRQMVISRQREAPLGSASAIPEMVDGTDGVDDAARVDGAPADVLLEWLDDEREENSKADEGEQTSVVSRRGGCNQQGDIVQHLDDITSPGKDVAR
uniref:Uncharacterized protein n=1 Tax=Oryza punctata TaxID=4537 RepID=A0A0E0MED1_ORYPU